jgi:hypothetical protein
MPRVCPHLSHQTGASKGKASPELLRQYQSIIGSLLYLMIGTHPDIAFVVTKLAQFSANPSQEHFEQAKYICRYLIGTKNYSLVFKHAPGKGLATYMDSDWALQGGQSLATFSN